MKPAEPVCSQCLHWRRECDTKGTCWHPMTLGGQMRTERDTCPEFARKVIRVRTASSDFRL